MRAASTMKKIEHCHKVRAADFRHETFLGGP
jgi:hypothetical protein